jgi:thymidylate synthase
VKALNADFAWHMLLRDALQNGEPRQDRTCVGTRALFGAQCRFDLRDGFPAVTTKRLHFRQVAAELSAFIAGAESLAEFNGVGCTLWDANASAPAWQERQRFPGDVGRIYGVQWRRWRSVLAGRELRSNPEFVEVDQLRQLVDGLRTDPHGRRHVVTAWNPGELGQMCLPPCHIGFQCFASDETSPAHLSHGSLDLCFHMRSLDLFLGMPFDVASYALLAHLLAHETGRRARYLVMTAGDAHVYNNHRAQVETVLARERFEPPELVLAAAEPRRVGTLRDFEKGALFGFLPDDARLEGYESHPSVPAPLNV